VRACSLNRLSSDIFKSYMVFIYSRELASDDQVESGVSLTQDADKVCAAQGGVTLGPEQGQILQFLAVTKE
jgi:hypothetical protein